FRFREFDDQFCKAPNFELDWTAQIDRPGEIVRCFHKPDQRIDEIVDVAKGSRLLAFTVNGDGLASQGLDDEIGYDPAVVRVHPRPIGIENPGHLDSQLMLAM